MRHRTESNNMQRGTLMSFQEFSDGTLPEYFHNLWRKKVMTEKEIETEKEQLAKLWKNEMMEKEGYEEMEKEGYEESECFTDIKKRSE